MKVILYLYERGEVRYSELAKLIASRGSTRTSIKGDGGRRNNSEESSNIQTNTNILLSYPKRQGGRQKDKRDRDFTSEKLLRFFTINLAGNLAGWLSCVFRSGNIKYF
jgi:hypothetical protein